MIILVGSGGVSRSVEQPETKAAGGSPTANPQVPRRSRKVEMASTSPEDVPEYMYLVAPKWLHPSALNSPGGALGRSGSPQTWRPALVDWIEILSVFYCVIVLLIRTRSRMVASVGQSPGVRGDVSWSQCEIKCTGHTHHKLPTASSFMGSLSRLQFPFAQVALGVTDAHEELESLLTSRARRMVESTKVRRDSAIPSSPPAEGIPGFPELCRISSSATSVA